MGGADNGAVRTVLSYNPVSGGGRAVRPGVMAAVARVLGEHGHAVEVEATVGPGSAGEQARAAVRRGVELIVACGGDGTVHDTLQGLVGAGEAGDSGPVLGVLPMGSANALARHLGLATDPVRAARQLAGFRVCRVPVGCVETARGSRYFTVMAGAGPSGSLVYGMLPGAKRRLGRMAYYARAIWLVATRGFPAFELVWTDAADGIEHQAKVVGAMAVRIGSLGGLFHRLAPACDVHEAHLSVVGVRPPGWLGLPAWFAGSWVRRGWAGPLVMRAETAEFSIVPEEGSRAVQVQADGEWLGPAPARVRLMADGVRMLVP